MTVSKRHAGRYAKPHAQSQRGVLRRPTRAMREVEEGLAGAHPWSLGRTPLRIPSFAGLFVRHLRAGSTHAAAVRRGFWLRSSPDGATEKFPTRDAAEKSK